MANSTLIAVAWTGVSGSALITAAALFMHGIYVVLAVLALLFLYQRRPAGAAVLGGLIAAMCVLGTAAMVLQVGSTVFWLESLHSAAQNSTTASQVQGLEHTEDVMMFVEMLLVIANNAIADGLLIYRCYVIWAGSHQKVVILPVVLALASAASGYVAAHREFGARNSTLITPSDSRIFYGLVVATNLSLTLLTVGRILHTRRDLKSIGKTKFVARYNTAIKMLLESAVLYLVFSCATIFVRSLDEFDAANVFYGLNAPLMNIIPTLLVVRISLAAKRTSAVSPAFQF
ncbi:hypothetical protein B0H17DRAFT_718347 [Mycena rosella]|uniref:Uncharacterized protein n=1 Tax=Mycena rosella TaxID=1033263 RepID=A0AAD7D9D7_MYCRO|nr:hypothetical protein B0H17DRAFT_718347 [Mycena rosella]